MLASRLRRRGKIMRKSFKTSLIVLAAILFCILISLCGINKWFNDYLSKQYNNYPYTMPSIDKNGILYIDKNISDSIDPEMISECLRSNELFLNIKYKIPIKIIICIDDKESARLFPLFQTQSSGFAFSNNLIIINYNNLYKLGYTLKSIIKHESLHTLMKQNIKSLTSMMITFSNQSLWFSEGVAIYNQDLVIYTKNEIKEKLFGEKIIYDSKNDNIQLNPKNMRLLYSVYYYFIDYLVDKYGKDKVSAYITEMLNNYHKSQANYVHVFNEKIQNDINNYSNILMTGN